MIPKRVFHSIPLWTYLTEHLIDFCERHAATLQSYYLATMIRKCNKQSTAARTLFEQN